MTVRTVVAGGRSAAVLGARRPQQVNLCSLHRAFTDVASKRTYVRSPCFTRYTETSVPYPALSNIALDQPLKVQLSDARKLSQLSLYSGSSAPHLLVRDPFVKVIELTRLPVALYRVLKPLQVCSRSGFVPSQVVGQCRLLLL